MIKTSSYRLVLQMGYLRGESLGVNVVSHISNVIIMYYNRFIADELVLAYHTQGYN